MSKASVLSVLGLLSLTSCNVCSTCVGVYVCMYVCVLVWAKFDLILLLLDSQ